MLSARRHITSLLAVVAALTMAAPAPASAAPPKQWSLGAGGWCWFADPRSVHHEGAHNRTYTGWIDRDADVKVTAFDHRTRLRTTIELRRAIGRIDDHDNPALHVLPDGRLMVLYSHHGGRNMFYRVSRRPEDITSWHDEQTMPTNTAFKEGHYSGYTYPNPAQLRAEDNRLWLFWRGGTAWPSFSTSMDDGKSWTKARNLISSVGHRPYIKYSSNDDDTIHFAFTQGHPATLNSNIYYARYRGGQLYRADGSRIKSMAELPLKPREADKVYDTGSKAWIHDVAHTPSGRPIVVYAVIDKSGEHHYEYARWTGTRWESHFVTAAGGSIADNGDEPYYSGGITLDHENPSVAYLSREVDGMFEVERWRTPDGGKSWAHSKITSGSSVENVRPVSPRGLLAFDDDMSVLWMRGTYVHYVDFRTSLTTLLLNGGNVPPSAHATARRRNDGAPLSVEFDGGGSRDPDGSIVSWSWTFGDGTRGSGRTVTHSYSTPGRRFAKLVVTDDAGDRDAYVVEVNVGE